MKTKYKYILIIIEALRPLRVRAPTDLKFLGIKTCYNSLPRERAVLILADGKFAETRKWRRRGRANRNLPRHTKIANLRRDF